MDIVKKSISDPQVLQLFSEHDDFMMDFLGEDKKHYARYSVNEKIESVWIVYDVDLPVGCVAYRKKSDAIGEVKRLFIQREYRGRGISKSLLTVLKSYAKTQGCQKLFLDTKITLEPAISLYRSFGFDIITQHGLYVQMEMEL